MYLLLIFTHSSLMQRSRNVQDVLNVFCTFFSSWTSSFRAYTASTRLLRQTNRESSLGVHNIDPEWHRVRIRLWCSLLLDDSLPVALHLLHDDFLFLWQKHLRHTLFPYSCHTHTHKCLPSLKESWRCYVRTPDSPVVVWWRLAPVQYASITLRIWASSSRATVPED